MIKLKGESHPEGCESSVDDYMFDAELLKEINWGEKTVTFKDDLSPTHLVNNLLLRPLSSSDYWKGYIELLSQLTTVGSITEEMFSKRYNSMKRSGDYYCMVVEDCGRGLIIASCTLVVEQKFIHATSTRGRVEDVVVLDEYRGQQLGKLLAQTALLLSKHLGCYKTSLECHQDKVDFYKMFSFRPDSVFMTVRHHE